MSNSHNPVSNILGSCESSPTAVDSIRSAVTRGSNKLGGGHRRSVSTTSGNSIPPLIYSGGGGSGSVSSSGSGCRNVGVGGMVNSPIVNALPTGNICPSGKILKTACRSNRAAALTGLGRLAEAVRECEEALRLDTGYSRAHQSLASLLRIDLDRWLEFHGTSLQA
ncbi:hypothetical protein IFM89_038417 [Coptis chinensis]|uniref:Uncharacterized protein n=1 Tax=Coptis chinensis TaxID=261450 RepID=A0A835LJZ7_9MAGN|nr:hypothetical protein IFM89_038417 [Coptis chinensis]